MYDNVNEINVNMTQCVKTLTERRVLWRLGDSDGRDGNVRRRGRETRETRARARARAARRPRVGVRKIEVRTEDERGTQRSMTERCR